MFFLDIRPSSFNDLQLLFFSSKNFIHHNQCLVFKNTKNRWPHRKLTRIVFYLYIDYVLHFIKLVVWPKACVPWQIIPWSIIIRYRTTKFLQFYRLTTISLQHSSSTKIKKCHYSQFHFLYRRNNFFSKQ